MKSRKWTVVITALCALAIPLSLTAQTAFTIGGNYWNTSRALSGDYFEDLESESSNMIGPYLNIRIGNIIIGGSMFFGTFKETSTENDEYEVDMKRKDLNFSVGFSLSPSLNVFFAMKKLTMNGSNEFNFDYYYPGYYYYYVIPVDVEVEYKEDGTLYGGGLSGVIRFPQSKFFLFWSGAYLTGTRQYETTESISAVGYHYEETTEFEPKTNLLAYNVGAGYQVASNITLLVGYRADNISSEWEPEGWDETIDAKENYSGISATLAITVR